ncbi:hypothetical protein [Pseudanabaena sp. FACHB-2040]|uniref:hypothetical protein n=1 Tax=Pseudanabaena sp. FACHB-2040 TaxID=2692859 RepID=UPI0016858362|nr:hypothetical protein [Pseudanabaena sp. FACHB-2040]MBD2256593.1 hypothetical protein [Pseudanabaena sp. FACHB-2040]
MRITDNSEAKAQSHETNRRFKGAKKSLPAYSLATAFDTHPAETALDSGHTLKSHTPACHPKPPHRRTERSKSTPD